MVRNDDDLALSRLYIQGHPFIVTGYNVLEHRANVHPAEYMYSSHDHLIGKVDKAENGSGP